MNPAHDPKPLYLEPEQPYLVSIDGPALCLADPQGKERHLPLRRISRIIAHENVQFHTEALIACAKRDIPILIHSEDHAHVRIIGPAPHPNTTFRQALIDLQQRPDWTERYVDWRRSNHYRITRLLAQRLQAPRVLDRNPGLLRNWIEQRVEELSDPETQKITRHRFYQLSLSWIQKRLHQEGLGSESENLLRDRIDLPAQLAMLLDERIQTIRLGWLKRRHRWAKRHGRHPEPVTTEQIVRIFEKDSARISKLGDDLINRFHRWLIEIQ